MRQRSDLSVEGSPTAERIPAAPDLTEPRVPIERAFIGKHIVLLCVWSVVLRFLTFVSQGGNHLGFEVAQHFPERG